MHFMKHALSYVILCSQWWSRYVLWIWTTTKKLYSPCHFPDIRVNLCQWDSPSSPSSSSSYNVGFKWSAPLSGTSSLFVSSSSPSPLPSQWRIRTTTTALPPDRLQRASTPAKKVLSLLWVPQPLPQTFRIQILPSWTWTVQLAQTFPT